MQERTKKWLALNNIPDLGVVGIKKLWDHFGSVEKIWEATYEELAQIEGLSKKASASLVNQKDKIEKEIKLPKNASILTLEDEDYPKNLKNIYDPPPVLYFKGEIKPQDQKAIAIVGTRTASHYGKETARRLASQLAEAGLTIVSGMALGIDSAAHEGGLEARGRTLAVFGCGVDIIYPPQNKGLAEKIANTGALISEFPPGTKVEKGFFPRRNRIISGLSLGVIVVEGHYDSGAMITAKAALDQGREVFAVPGNIEVDQSKGPHWLIKQGAKLVESVEDVLEELHMVMPKQMTNDTVPAGRQEGKDYSNLSPDEQKIISVLSLEPKHIDHIAADCGLSIQQVSSILMMLEVKNVIRQLPGKQFVVI